MANVYSQFDLTVAPEQVQSRNVAVVMVSAMLPPFARPGDAVDVVVTSAGDARSLVGGNLLATALKAPNGKIYALAQGPLSVGGYRYDMNGNVVQKNHPTAGSIPGGALVEVGVNAQVVTADGAMTFVLSNPDYTTAGRVANEINRALGRRWPRRATPPAWTSRCPSSSATTWSPSFRASRRCRSRRTSAPR